MIQRPLDAPQIEGPEQFQQAADEVNNNFSCIGRCRDISFAVSGIFLAYQAIDYYTSGKTYSAALSGISLCLVGSSYYIVRKYGDIHVITRAMKVALQKLTATSREVRDASLSIRATAESIEPIATNVITNISAFQESLKAMAEAARRMEEGNANVEEFIRILDKYSNGV